VEEFLGKVGGKQNEWQGVKSKNQSRVIIWARFLFDRSAKAALKESSPI